MALRNLYLSGKPLPEKNPQSSMGTSWTSLSTKSPVFQTSSAVPPSYPSAGRVSSREAHCLPRQTSPNPARVPMTKRMGSSACRGHKAKQQHLPCTGTRLSGLCSQLTPGHRVCGLWLGLVGNHELQSLEESVGVITLEKQIGEPLNIDTGITIVMEVSTNPFVKQNI